MITKLFAIEVFRVDSESSSENGLTSAGTYATHQSSDEGTLVADQPRCRSSATSSETEGISVHLFGSTRGDQDSGSIRSGIAEGDEIEGSFQGRESVSTKPADGKLNYLRGGSGNLFMSCSQSYGFISSCLSNILISDSFSLILPI